MRRVVAPLREYLTGERIPIPIEQGLPLCVRHRRKPLHILRVVCQQGRIVKYTGWHKDPRLRRAVLRPVRVFPRRILRDRRHRRCRRDKPFLHPRMPHVSWVRRRADINPRPRPVRAVSREQIHIFVVGEVRQLVKCDEVIRLPLILRPVLRVLHRTEDDLRPRGECPGVGRCVVLRAVKCRRVIAQRLVDQLRELVVGLAEDQRLVVRNIHLTQRLDHKRVALSAASSSAI